ncbi:MAG: hypothetical protein KF892_23945 [Rhizobacter sp.]|nr:hypothetical protein [Rhizobacter sp.]
MKIALIQLVNVVLLAFLSTLALDAWWKFFLFGLLVILITSALAVRFKRSATALTVGALPIAWMAGLALFVVANLLGFHIG